jgi:hypothetical protein
MVRACIAVHLPFWSFTRTSGTAGAHGLRRPGEPAVPAVSMHQPLIASCTISTMTRIIAISRWSRRAPMPILRPVEVAGRVS